MSDANAPRFSGRRVHGPDWVDLGAKARVWAVIRAPGIG
jgi:hypothetical protein